MAPYHIFQYLPQSLKFRYCCLETGLIPVLFLLSKYSLNLEHLSYFCSIWKNFNIFLIKPNFTHFNRSNTGFATKLKIDLNA